MQVLILRTVTLPSVPAVCSWGQKDRLWGRGRDNIDLTSKFRCPSPESTMNPVFFPPINFSNSHLFRGFWVRNPKMVVFRITWALKIFLITVKYYRLFSCTPGTVQDWDTTALHSPAFCHFVFTVKAGSNQSCEPVLCWAEHSTPAARRGSAEWEEATQCAWK